MGGEGGVPWCPTVEGSRGVCGWGPMVSQGRGVPWGVRVRVPWCPKVEGEAVEVLTK
jgi:hypothetical protein